MDITDYGKAMIARLRLIEAQAIIGELAKDNVDLLAALVYTKQAVRELDGLEKPE